MSDFWNKVNEQLKELRSATTADEVLSIVNKERNPYGDPNMVAGDGFFAGDSEAMEDVMHLAGWSYVWRRASYYWCMKAPNGDHITYVEGDVYRGHQDPV